MLLPDFQEMREDTELLLQRLRNAAELTWQRAQNRLDRLRSAKALMRPVQMLQERMQSIDYTVKDMENLLFRAAQEQEHRLLRLNDKLQTLNPVRILNRGYAVLLDNRGKAVTLPSQIPAGSEATAILAHGRVRMESKGEVKP